MREKVVEEFAIRMARRAKDASNYVRRLEAELSGAHEQLKLARQCCPHIAIKHHDRASAECDSWDECLDCGASVQGRDGWETP